MLCICGLSIPFIASAQEMATRFEKSGGTQSSPYTEVIDFYHQLDKQHGTVKIVEAGGTDTRHPLHVVYYSQDKQFDIETWKADNKVILLINNAIHPGEPDGIDASMMLLRNAATGKINMPENIVLAVIPVFNIGGALDRGSHSRANQNGPEEYGFRGSAQNLDLNRDFIKLDAKETQSLIRLFHRLDPDIFIDNHVSNGADYQHIMTLLSTQHNKLGGTMGQYLHNIFEPAIYADMKQKGYDLVPYVNHWGHTPERGWIAFHEGPRFASGFATLFQTYSFVPETHMLKPFKQRVEATYTLMTSFISLASKNAADIRRTRKAERAATADLMTLPIEWKVDTTKPDKIEFRGYKSGYKPSEVSGKPRLYYDRQQPYTTQVTFHNYYKPVLQADVPKAYVIQQGWPKVIRRLKWNGVKMQALERDTTINLSVTYIDNYETAKPYEGHYLHSKVKAHTVARQIKLLKGDYLIPTNQKAERYIVETLEPTAPDAFFAWGFFDAILQQKEGFSDYVFEDEAAELLKSTPELRRMLKEKQQADTAFAKDGEAQLEFVYQHSPYYEPVHMRYPVYKLEWQQ